jgi:2-phosphosulfolactate phosphatase
MNVSIKHGELNAGKAREKGQVIVVDALRACSSIVTALNAGASSVLPVENPEQARKYTGRKGFVTAGETNGEKINGLDLGNSPRQMLEADLKGKKLVLTTTNGVKCIKAAGPGCIIGCLLNATAAARHASGDVTIIVAGRKGKSTREDLLTATEIAKALGAKPEKGVESQDFIKDFMESESGIHLKKLGKQEDVKFCARKDVYNIAPVFNGQEIINEEEQVRKRLASLGYM